MGFKNFRTSHAGFSMVEVLVALGIVGFGIIALQQTVVHHFAAHATAKLNTVTLQSKSAIESFIWHMMVAHSEYNCQWEMSEFDRHFSGQELMPNSEIRIITQIPQEFWTSSAAKYQDFCANPLLPSGNESQMRFCFLIEHKSADGLEGSSFLDGKFLLVAAKGDFRSMVDHSKKVACYLLREKLISGGALVQYAMFWGTDYKNEDVSKEYHGIFYGTN